MPPACQLDKGTRKGILNDRLSSELLVYIAGIVHELAASEVFTVFEDLIQLQVVILVLISHSNHLLGLIQRIELVHGVHVLLNNRKNHKDEQNNRKDRTDELSEMYTKPLVTLDPKCWHHCSHT